MLATCLVSIPNQNRTRIMVMLTKEVVDMDRVSHRILSLWFRWFHQYYPNFGYPINNKKEKKKKKEREIRLVKL